MISTGLESLLSRSLNLNCYSSKKINSNFEDQGNPSHKVRTLSSKGIAMIARLKKTVSVLALASAFFSMSARAELLDCNILSGHTTENISNANIAIGFYQKYNVTCLPRNADGTVGTSVRVIFEGYGPTINMVDFQSFAIHCPEAKKIQGRIYGIRTEANLMFGGGVGLYGSKNNGSCKVGAFTFSGLGGNFLFSSFEVKEERK